MRKWIDRLILIAGITMMVVGGWNLWKIYAEYHQGTETYEEAVEEFVETVPETAVTTEDAESTTEAVPETEAPLKAWSDTCPIKVDFARLKAQNSDVVGWLYSEGSRINYPVMQAADNDYYLHRMLNGGHNSAGSLFMEAANKASMSDLNTIIYGHNMKNNSMFGTLTDYHSQNYYNRHPYVWYLTPDKTWRVDILAGFVTQDDSDTYTIFAGEDELAGYLQRCLRKSTFRTAVDVSGNEQILTLSTCSYEYQNARYVLVGKMVPVS